MLTLGFLYLTAQRLFVGPGPVLGQGYPEE